MQVNRCQSPNFGMALRIKPEAMEVFEKGTIETIQKFNKIGEELKNHKYVDLIVGKDLKTTINVRGCANAYGGDLVLLKGNNYLFLNTKLVGLKDCGVKESTPYSINIPQTCAKDLEITPEKFNNKSWLDKFVEATKLLEAKYAQKASEEAAEKTRLAELKSAAAKLFESFGIKS